MSIKFVTVYLQIFPHLFVTVYLQIFLHLFVTVYLQIFLRLFVTVYLQVFLHLFVTVYLQIFLHLFVTVYLQIFLHLFVTVYLQIFLQLFVLPLTFDRCSDRGANTSDCVRCGQNSSNKATGNFKWTEVRGGDYKSSLQSHLPQEVQTCQSGMFPYWTHRTNYDCPSGGCCAQSTVSVTE
jgi:hypothetical protein